MRSQRESLPHFLQSNIDNGLHYLEKSCRPITGFQNDCIGTSRRNLEKNYYPEEIFTNLIGLDLLGDYLSSRCKSILIKFVTLDGSATGVLNFNKYVHPLPDDMEDTALYHYVFLKEGVLQQDKRILDVARLIYLNTAENGVIQLYYTPCEKERRGRMDAGSLCNAMRFLYYVGAAEEAQKTEDYLYDWLISDEYLNGTRYYASPDAFLYFCSEAVIQNKRAREKFEQPLLEALRKRTVEINEDQPFPIDLALRILALSNLGKLNSPDFSLCVKNIVDVLRDTQDVQTGAWPKDSLFKFGRTERYLGGSVVSTIIATAALIEFRKTDF